MEDLELKLKRQEFSSTATMGVMSVNGLRIADTLEDCQRKLPETCPYTPKGKSCKCPEKVYGETCICLLYTSPSPRDYAASRMPSSA